MRRLASMILLALAPLFAATPAFGFFSEIWGYLKQYQLGIDYTSSYDRVDATYDTDLVNGQPGAGCGTNADGPTRQTCTVSMEAGRSSGYGIFLQQAFKRQGFFYFKPDVGFGARYLEGGMSDEAKKQSEESGLPLDELRFSMAALVVKPYLRFGITPQGRFPDLLLSLGPAAQVGIGNVTVNDEKEDVAMATSSGSFVTGFVELEAVFWRFGDGALSVFTSQDYSGDGEGTKFYPKAVDGMDNFRANFSRSVGGGFFGFGAKLVLNWP